MKISHIKKFFIFLLFFSIAFASIHFSLGPGESIKKSIAVVGDSYAEYFRDFIETEEIDYYSFPRQGINHPANEELLSNCIKQDKHDFILLCVGASDYLLKNDPKLIEESLIKQVNLAKEKHKYLFFHTYMNFPNSKAYKHNVFPIKEYDTVFKKLAEENYNVFYIDMDNLNDEHYHFGDGTHFGDLFYFTLYAKFIYMVGNAEQHLYTYTLPWMAKQNIEELAVVGDTYARIFYNYERNKELNLLDFTNNGYTASQITNSFIDATNSTAKYLLLSFGVFDYEKQTDLNSFEDVLRQFLNLSSITHKSVFLHSYMFYQASRSLPIKTTKYDDIIKKLAIEYPNVIYIDTHKYEVAEYQMKDLTNYNRSFNDDLYIMIKNFIDTLK